MRANDYQFICETVYRHSRINLGSDKVELVSARLAKRLRAIGLPSITDYCRYLQGPQGADEIGQLIDVISTNHTFFFREQGHFDALRDIILPDLVRRRERERWSHLRLWSAASSSGEEPYSLAIAFEEFLASQRVAWPWKIEGTDISSRILVKARQAIYPKATIDRLPAGFAKKYFQVGFGDQEGFYRVKAELRDRVNFSRMNLLEGAIPFREPFQIIFCRNVMIYFDRDTQAELVKRLKSCLVPGGYLLVGHSESLSGIDHGLKLIRPATYQLP